METVRIGGKKYSDPDVISLIRATGSFTDPRSSVLSQARNLLERVKLPVLDFQDIENAEAIWTTETWLDSRHEFVFFARSTPEEIQEAIRGTERDPSIFLEAGWTSVEGPPPPAHQVASDSVDVDLIENASHSLRSGIEAYLASRNNSSELVTAVPMLFRAVELLLKARLEELNPKAISAPINNPTVLNLSLAKISSGLEIPKLRGTGIGLFPLESAKGETCGLEFGWADSGKAHPRLGGWQE